jgi:hypothetical protein
MSHSPNRPEAGSSWTLTLMIAHNEPNEVDVLAPEFTGPLFLEQVIKVPRFINPESTERWTAMEYRFMLNSPEIISFDSFTVITPQGQTRTNPFELTVRPAQGAGELQRYQLVWEGIPSSLKTGENAVCTLRVNGWNAAYRLPEPALFLPPVPPGHILESLPITGGEQSAGVALKLRLIPLSTGNFILNRRQVTHGGTVFEIPALRIPVGQGTTAATERETSPESAGPIPTFPPLEKARHDHRDLYQKNQSECETVYTSARFLWETGLKANALAMLRKNERDHPAGVFFAALRHEAERSLGFTDTNNEQKQFLAGLRNLLPFLREKPRAIILKDTAVRRIPDMAGEEFASFREGQPVLIKSHHETWLQIITNDDRGTSGWIPEQNIIRY